MQQQTHECPLNEHGEHADGLGALSSRLWLVHPRSSAIWAHVRKLEGKASNVTELQRLRHQCALQLVAECLPSLYTVVIRTTAACANE